MATASAAVKILLASLRRMGEIRPRQEFGAERGAETRPGQRVDEPSATTGTDVTISV